MQYFTIEKNNGGLSQSTNCANICFRLELILQIFSLIFVVDDPFWCHLFGSNASSITEKTGDKTSILAL